MQRRKCRAAHRFRTANACSRPSPSVEIVCLKGQRLPAPDVHGCSTTPVKPRQAVSTPASCDLERQRDQCRALQALTCRIRAVTFLLFLRSQGKPVGASACKILIVATTPFDGRDSNAAHFDFGGRPVLTGSTALTAARRRFVGSDASRRSPARTSSLFFTATPASRHRCLSTASFS